MKRVLIITFLLFLFFSPGRSQDLSTRRDSSKSLIYEKVYLFSDRELYAPGEVVWFKTYLVSGLTHQLLPGYTNIFVQLVSEGGKVYDDRILLSSAGTAHGEFILNDSIPEGQYIIRVFTRYLENFGEQSYFHKKVVISATYQPSVNGKSVPPASVADVAFLPEGGTLVMNALNYLAFKAIDKTGKGIDISGRIVDENDSVVTTFRTDFLGMGKAMLMPADGKNYRAVIDQLPGFSHSFSGVRENGVTLHFRPEGAHLLFIVSRNFKNTGTRKIYLVASHKGYMLFYREMQLTGFQEALKISRALFPPGISKITLLDDDFQELSERLIFNPDEPGRFIMHINGKKFTTRDSVRVELEFQSDDHDSVTSALSVAVVGKDFLNPGGSIQTLRSYLLLDSELKGTVESPSSFFADGDKISSTDKLDLLMMVHGWRSYYWDELNTFRFDRLTGWNDAGLSVTGYVKMLLRNVPVMDGEVVLGPFSGGLHFERTRTDSLGRFAFNRLYLRDSSMVILNARSGKDKANTEILTDPVFPFIPSVPDSMLRKACPWPVVPLLYLKDDLYRQMKREDFIPEKGNILLGEVKVYGSRRDKEDNNFRAYPQPDKVFKIKEEDYTCENILDYLQGKGGGVIVSGDQISIRGGGVPLFLLDGIQVMEDMVENLVMQIHMNDIDKIEILRDGGSLAAFGSKGADGVIAVYTKKGRTDTPSERYVRGRIIQRVRGFRKPLQFYSPLYTPATISTTQPDYRPTLFWDPSVKMQGDHAAFTFFTSDEMSDYWIIVEGISKNGKICSLISDFSVTGKYSR